MREVRRTILEMLIIAVAGLCVGFVGNAINKNGLTLSRNYWPKLAPITGGFTPATTTPASGIQSQPATTAPMNEAEIRLINQGIGIASYEDVKTLMADPLFGTTEFVIDARNDEHYAAGHVAGAYHVYQPYIDRYLPQILPQLLPAQKIIVYCNGGAHCEESESTAVELIKSGVDRSHVFVYVGGYQDWIARHEPLEKGERGSGNITTDIPQ